MKVTLPELQEIFERAFSSKQQINENTLRTDLDSWDSINHLNLIIELEDHYKVQFTKEQIESINSVSDIIKHLESL